MVQATTTVAQPIAWGTTIGLTSQPILPANPSRQALIFFNASTVSIAIAPSTALIGTLGVYPSPAVPTANTAGINTAGSITMLPNDKLIIDNIACTCAWVGIAAAAGGAVTIFEHT